MTDIAAMRDSFREAVAYVSSLTDPAEQAFAGAQIFGKKYARMLYADFFAPKENP